MSQFLKKNLYNINCFILIEIKLVSCRHLKLRNLTEEFINLPPNNSLNCIHMYFLYFKETTFENYPDFFSTFI